MNASRQTLRDPRLRNRMFYQLLAIFGVLFAVLILRLFYIQILKGEYNHRLSLENMMRLKVIKAPRGRIFDRYGRLMVRNRPSYSITVYPYKVMNKKKLFSDLIQLRTLAGEPVFAEGDLSKTYRKALQRRFDPTILEEDAGIELASVIEEHTLELPGVGIETEIRREYPYGSMAFHLFGYISEIPEEEFDSLKNVGYLYGDLIGKMGVEKQYEKDFRGINGVEYIEVNAFGKEQGKLSEMPSTSPMRGNDLYLTLDLDLQLAAEEAFPDSLTGAAVAVDPRNGEVLVMLSSPRPDPNLFTYSSEKRTKLWVQVALDPRQPLNNRAIQGTYPPGSTFKMVTAVAGLEDGLIRVDEHFRPCVGAFRFGTRSFKCWEEKGHGALGIIDALKRSCDVYFYQLGLRVGTARINKYATILGMDDRTEINLPNEKNGLLLDEEKYNKKYGGRGWVWSPGMTLNLAIGQGQVVTPIQLVNYISAFGNGEVIYRPHVIKEIHYPDGRPRVNIGKSVLRPVKLKKETIRVIREAIYAVVNKPGGTGWAAHIKDVPVGGKTGSAQNPQGDLTHALFVACAPVDSPTIAVCVVVENAGHGGSVAGPIVGKILQAYFKKFPLIPAKTDTLTLAQKGSGQTP